ncbi:MULTISPECIES: phosphonate ABC transporter ATP-binding protein [unclassified Undibacterium]|uniref:phosphonate ABC transporter ATP-binding protein n=1 Tax=unclassified Undibacterium TaxID=2630295 RepID=UPI002AC9173B|nr:MULTISPECIES: ATP-binding cassette domain-containing protein [unclassified Undibacterium]MEB0140502.1 ATP-binding cassette domain-containing protein [Undibacterium sp. CCC2.1]MEB0173521.1 ATP-binding cassette domain-containing protein [Undibacterium sp. CCC1.1]MEB0177507.1 ATP-binding cassette domain-containing protein [Undibacterium sp. CCC3.4]MEB0216627.1 ATP-binding cassette domain-containing protein [Undibacterium sp. 5I2]WPX42344.1 ATP-binding cassette domain-containing protein [Undiba
MPAALSLQQLAVRHPGTGVPQYALRDLNIEIPAGEQIALIGPSGAGKTTLLHTLAGALRPSSGHLFVGQQDPWQLSESARHRWRRHLFLAPQTAPLPARQRVITTVLAGRLPHWSLLQALRNLIRPQDPRAAWQALARFHLEHKLYARVDQLSGGERQRCGLARLLLSDASLLLVDEPLSALDPTLAQQTLATLQQEARQRQATLICSLHNVDLARSCFDRLIGLRDGKILFDSREVSDHMIAELYRNAQSTVAAQL